MGKPSAAFDTKARLQATVGETPQESDSNQWAAAGMSNTAERWRREYETAKPKCQLSDQNTKPETTKRIDAQGSFAYILCAVKIMLVLMKGNKTLVHIPQTDIIGRFKIVTGDLNLSDKPKKQSGQGLFRFLGNPAFGNTDAIVEEKFLNILLSLREQGCLPKNRQQTSVFTFSCERYVRKFNTVAFEYKDDMFAVLWQEMKKELQYFRDIASEPALLLTTTNDILLDDISVQAVIFCNEFPLWIKDREKYHMPDGFVLTAIEEFHGMKFSTLSPFLRSEKELLQIRVKKADTIESVIYISTDIHAAEKISFHPSKPEE